MLTQVYRAQPEASGLVRLEGMTLRDWDGRWFPLSSGWWLIDREDGYWQAARAGDTLELYPQGTLRDAIAHLPEEPMAEALELLAGWL